MEEIETNALMKLYISFRAVQRNANELRQDVAEVLLTYFTMTVRLVGHRFCPAYLTPQSVAEG